MTHWKTHTYTYTHTHKHTHTHTHTQTLTHTNIHTVVDLTKLIFNNVAHTVHTTTPRVTSDSEKRLDSWYVQCEQHSLSRERGPL